MAIISYDNIAFSNKKQLFWYLNSKPFKTKEDLELAKKLKKQIKFTMQESWQIII